MHHEKSAELLNMRLAALAEVIQSHENEIAKVSNLKQVFVRHYCSLTLTIISVIILMVDVLGF